MKHRSYSIALIVLLVSPTVPCCHAQDAPARDDLGASVVHVYKVIDGVELPIYVFNPPEHAAFANRPAIVFFFGGGWRAGTPKQFQQQCKYLASRGMVAMTAEYRVHSRHGVKVTQCIADAKSAIRWVRTNASCLGVDPCRIASGGGSAGGHLSAAVATLSEFDEPQENSAISSSPNAMLLYNPAVDITAEGLNRDPASEKQQELIGRMGTDPRRISPIFHVRSGLPPAIIFHGIADPIVPFSQAERFAKAMQAAGNRCDVDGYKGEQHGFFNFGRNGNKSFVATLLSADKFLTSLGYLEGPPTVDAFMETLAGKK